MRYRLQRLIFHVTHPRQPWSDIEMITGISRQRWRSACRGSQRVSEDMIEAVAKHWPQYVCWLVSGEEGTKVKQIALGSNE